MSERTCVAKLIEPSETENIAARSQARPVLVPIGPTDRRLLHSPHKQCRDTPSLRRSDFCPLSRSSMRLKQLMESAEAGTRRQWKHGGSDRGAAADSNQMGTHSNHLWLERRGKLRVSHCHFAVRSPGASFASVTTTVCSLKGRKGLGTRVAHSDAKRG